MLVHYAGQFFPDADLNKAKAAAYRFYKGVKLVGDQYECSFKNEREINISKKLFETLVNSLNALNAQIKKQKAAGVQVQTPEISEDYLQNLLK